MKKYLFKVRERKIGGYKYRIQKQYQPKDDTYHYLMYCKKVVFGYTFDWQQTYATTNLVRAKAWSDEMGLIITKEPNCIRNNI